MKKTSLFVEFVAEFPESDAERSRIHNADYLAEELTRSFNAVGIRVTDSDLWKDFGWCLVCNSLDADLDVLFAYYSTEVGGNDGWQLTVEPSNFPGAISRFLGRKPMPYLEGMQKLAQSLHNVLASLPMVGSIRYSLSTDVKKETDHPASLAW